MLASHRACRGSILCGLQRPSGRTIEDSVAGRCDRSATALTSGAQVDIGTGSRAALCALPKCRPRLGARPEGRTREDPYVAKRDTCMDACWLSHGWLLEQDC